MVTITRAQVEKAKKGLEKVTREAKRRLFEFETINNLYEISQGQSSQYKSAKSFIRSLAK